jgi:hypothetical protein
VLKRKLFLFVLILCLIGISGLVLASPNNPANIDRVEIDMGSHVDIVSASKAPVWFQIADNKIYYAIYNKTEGLATFGDYENRERNNCDPKWVWRSSLKDSYII